MIVYLWVWGVAVTGSVSARPVKERVCFPKTIHRFARFVARIRVSQDFSLRVIAIGADTKNRVASGNR
jgi:hypothetical protein